MSSALSRRVPYGIDAPPVPLGLAATGLACCLAARWRKNPWPAAAGAVLLAHAGVYLHTTVRGKVQAWRDVLGRLGLNGDEHLLDLGCGRGAVLIEAARRLPAGRAVGVDLWHRHDQSGNAPAATLANAALAGVRDRVSVHTADMTALPFTDGSFDVVTSALAIHNIPAGGRTRALDEAMRVLRPGGQLLIADFWPMARKYAAHLGHGTLEGLGPGYWYGGPWFGITLLHATRQPA